MKVRATQLGWIYNQLRAPGTEFELVEYEHSSDKDANGRHVKITVDQQFSSNWMEKIEHPKVRRKPGPKPKRVTNGD